MPKHKFTELVDDMFGGVYVTPWYSARAGNVMNLSEAEVSRINRDFPGLIAPVTDDAEPGPQKSIKGGKDKMVHDGEDK